ncbi:MAG: 1-acyl-sn-glycerol-3-phosphate acyltransferase [Deltaproteobacteria bacterium]|nr:1-acyl-sn-glycerol-3-phosphate acyltransferase [Deltaproteobacteria bacterium]
MSVYAVIAGVVGLAVDAFYRRTSLGGAVPTSGPVLLVANHPNGLIDPAVVLNTAARPVRMLAKAPLFDMPGISWLVKGMNALPVYRQKDGADTAHNAATFRAVSDALAAGHAVLIFPEGISHHEPQLQRLKTGAARMALSAVEAGAGDLAVVPVGLTYRDKARFRSQVATLVGAPLPVAPFAARARGADDAEAVRALTEAIDDALRDVTVNLDAWEDLPLLDAVDAIWRIGDPDRAARLKRLADGVAELRARAPERLAAVRARVVEWVTRLDALGLRASDLAPDHGAATARAGKALAFAARNLAVVLVGLPVAAFGALFFAVPFWTTHAVFLLARPSADVAATVKVLASLVFFPLWHVVAGWLLWASFGPSSALAVLAIAPLCGMTARWFFRSRVRALRDAAVFVRLLFARRLRRRLELERDLLVRAIDEVAAELDQR